MRTLALILASCSVLFAACTSVTSSPMPAPQGIIPVGSRLRTDTAGELAATARTGIYRVNCRSTGYGGTGFLHRSGAVVTAAHVVAGCAPEDLVLVSASGKSTGVAFFAADDLRDLALLRPTASASGTPLRIASTSGPQLGAQVTTWGYPAGYDGLAPLLSVGYLAGVQDFHPTPDTSVKRWVINAAFNAGNSGGPVFSVEDGRVIGVVSSKLAPLPEVIKNALHALDTQQYGLTYTGTAPDGSPVTITEGQLIGAILQYLRTQVQLVIGYAVTTNDLNAFLTAQGVTP